MERKNTVLLTVIAVATLLVAVVGATFAYFTATATGGETGGTATDVETAKVSGINVTSSPETVNNFENVYPGVWLATGVGVKAEYAGEHTGDFEVTYTLNGQIDLSAFKTASSTSTFTYNVYRVETSQANPITSCVYHNAAGTSGNPEMYVDGCALATALSEGTALYREDQSLDLSGDEDGKFDVTIADQKLDAEDADASGTHYYLVLKYANKTEENQAEQDAGKDIKIQLTGVTGTKVSAKSE